MSTLSVVLLVVVIVLAAAVALLLITQRRSHHLRSKFGPEYHRTVAELGGRAKAERDLERREKRIQRLDLRSLPPATRDRYVDAWRLDQARFVDDPKGAVLEADRLVQSVMRERGYPVADFDQRVDDISVDHPHVVENYRAARDIVVRHQRGEATTEDLRRALVHYRALFDELLEIQEVRV
ncbi:MAG TPA: hypothetical protein VMR62_23305 [Bryobacteraceae bacterium]|jgi:hypothetical protein|nr:hypothetical protein [Bryobacteraceae bacterium]